MIHVPVSFGEALDKLTILEIKLQYIPNPSEYVQRELDALQDSLASCNTPVIVFYKSMLKNVNTQIWLLQDDFRATDSPNEKTRLCEEIILLNDARHRIKQKVDRSLNSELREQKSYPKKKAFVLGHLGMGDQITCSPIVRYLSSMYDEVSVVSKTANERNVRMLYADDDSIKIITVEDDSDISPNFGSPIEHFNKIVEDSDPFLLGLHKLPPQPLTGLLPFCFYDDIGLERDYFLKYFYVPECETPGISLEIPIDLKICLVHSTTSMGQVFCPRRLKEQFGDDDSILVVDINHNPYEPGDIHYHMAAKFINLPLFSYVSLLRHAHYIALTDSSLFCIALCLPLVAEKFICYSRSTDYEYLNPIRKEYLEPLGGYVPIENKAVIDSVGSVT